MRMMNWIERLATDVRELLFPRPCLVCGATLGLQEQVVCNRCLSQLPYTHYRGLPENPVHRLFYPDTAVQRANAWMFYHQGSDTAHVVHALKYHGRREVGRTMGRLMACDVKPTGFFDGVDALVPVPLSRPRQRRRGYNQSEVLASGIAEVTGLPLWPEVVERTVDNPTQTRLSVEERRQNVEGIFRLCDAGKIRGRHLLLVDDVVTTGATLASCMAALSVAGGVRFSVLCMAVAASAACTPDGLAIDLDV